jgi:hypothetical protein
MIDPVAPSAQTVDLRPLVLQKTEIVSRALESYKISPQNITTLPVDEDPAWTDDAVATSAQFAPAAFSVADNLTVFTKGDLVVGFDVTDPVVVLKNQVQQLQKQVSQLTGTARGATRDTGRAPSKKKQ